MKAASEESSGQEPMPRGILPGEHRHHASLRSICGTLLGALALVVAANGVGEALLRSSPRNPALLTVGQKWRLLDSMDRSVAWLFLGDSSCNQGIDPSVVPTSAVNLCTIGSLGLTDDAWMLNDYLARADRVPEAVVLVHVYDIWQRPGPEPGTVAPVPRRWGFWRRQVPSIDYSARETFDVFLSRYVPLASKQQEIRAVLSDLAGLSPPREGAVRVPDGEDWRGFMYVDRGSPRQVHDNMRAHEQFVRTQPPAVSAANARALEVMVASAEEHGFDLYVAYGPILDSFAATPEFLEYRDALNDLIRQTAGSSGRFHLLTTMFDYPAERLTNTIDHVRGSSAADLTLRIVRAVEDGPGDP